MTKYAIIVAGGSGSRFGASIPKQFSLLAGKPVLMHTLSKFAAIPNVEIILVLPEHFVQWWNDLCLEHNFCTPHRIVIGGNSRFNSVKNAINTIDAKPGDLIAVHDGVRPLISTTLINAIFKQATLLGCAIPATPVTDSIRQIIDADNSVALSRDSLRAVQTPQTFNAIQLIKAYNVDFSIDFTDDASVFEHAGGSIHLIPGEITNIKITHPNDLVIAELLFKE